MVRIRTADVTAPRCMLVHDPLALLHCCTLADCPCKHSQSLEAPCRPRSATPGCATPGTTATTRAPPPSPSTDAKCAKLCEPWPWSPVEADLLAWLPDSGSRRPRRLMPWCLGFNPCLSGELSGGVVWRLDSSAYSML